MDGSVTEIAIALQPRRGSEIITPEDLKKLQTTQSNAIRRAEEASGPPLGSKSRVDFNANFLRAFQSSLQATNRNFARIPGNLGTISDPAETFLQVASNQRSLYSTATYQQNLEKRIRANIAFITGGRGVDLTTQPYFGCVVGIATPRYQQQSDGACGWVYVGSGVFIGRNVVLTAGHVAKDLSRHRPAVIFFGQNYPEQANCGPCIQRVDLSSRTSPRLFFPPVAAANASLGANANAGADLAVLLLDTEISGLTSATFAPVGSLDSPNSEHSVCVSGFGAGTNATTVRLAGCEQTEHTLNTCEMQIATYGPTRVELDVVPGLEFAALKIPSMLFSGNIDLGDSGGPAFLLDSNSSIPKPVLIDGKPALLGITHMYTPPDGQSPYGAGSIFERVDVQAYQDWIKSIPGARF
jgi:hypothetical protein